MPVFLYLGDQNRKQFESNADRRKIEPHLHREARIGRPNQSRESRDKMATANTDKMAG